MSRNDGVSLAVSLINQIFFTVQEALQDVAARLSLYEDNSARCDVMFRVDVQVAGVVNHALDPTPPPSPTPVALSLQSQLSSLLGGNAASLLSMLGASSGSQQMPAQTPAGLLALLASLGSQATPSQTPASPPGILSALGALGLGMVPGQTPAPRNLSGALASLGAAGATLEQGLADISNVEALVNPTAQAPAPGQALSSGASMQPSISQPSSGHAPPLAMTSNNSLQSVGSDVNSTMAELIGQINAAVTALNSTTSSTVSSLTAAIQRYNAAALALQQATDFTNATERVMGDVASQTDAALHALQSILNSTALTAGDLFQGMTAALGGATSAAAQDVVDGAQQIQDFLIGALADSFGSLQGVRGDISQSAAAAQDALSIMGPLAGNLSRSAAVAGFTAAGSSLQGTTSQAYNDVGSAAVALNDTLGQFGHEVMQLVRRISLPNPAAGLAAAVNRTQEVAAVVGDLQGILGSSVLGTLPSPLQGVLSSSTTPSSLNLVALDEGLVEYLSAIALVPGLAPVPAPSQAPVQAPAPGSHRQDAAQQPPQPPSPAAAPSTARLPQPSLPSAAAGVGSRAQQAANDAQGLGTLIGSSVLGSEDALGTLTASTSGLDLSAADQQLLALLAADTAAPVQAPSPAPALAASPAGPNLDNTLLSLLLADGPSPAQSPRQAVVPAPDTVSSGLNLSRGQARRALQVRFLYMHSLVRSLILTESAESAPVRLTHGSVDRAESER